MPKWLLEVNVVDGPVPYALWALTLVALIIVLIRHPRRHWYARAVLGILVGAAVGVAAVIVVNVTDVFGDPLPVAASVWATATLAALGLCVVSLWRRPVWRIVVAAVTIVLVAASGTLGVNAVFGIDHTLGAMLGQSTLNPIHPDDGPHPTATPTGPLYQSWTPPADMPATGRVGVLTGADAIPSTAGFRPRDASLYLPPAALVTNAPALPFMVYMMGQPGNPDPSFIAAALDQFAARNKGLAPIVIVVDQLGARDQDPACMDSKKFGGVDTYVNKDVVAYAKAKLNIIRDPAYWTMTGYSNGGACALTWAAKYPQIWGNLISISGDEFPGVELQQQTVRDVFDGDAAAYKAALPAAWLQKNQGRFAGHLAVFTGGQNDRTFLDWARDNTALAARAGFDAHFFEVPGADHNETAIRGGLPKALDLLYPKLGLAP